MSGVPAGTVFNFWRQIMITDQITLIYYKHLYNTFLAIGKSRWRLFMDFTIHIYLRSTVKSTRICNLICDSLTIKSHLYSPESCSCNDPTNRLGDWLIPPWYFSSLPAWTFCPFLYQSISWIVPADFKFWSSTTLSPTFFLIFCTEIVIE